MLSKSDAISSSKHSRETGVTTSNTQTAKTSNSSVRYMIEENTHDQKTKQNFIQPPLNASSHPVTSPIFNSIPVTNTSTPSSLPESSTSTSSTQSVNSNEHAKQDFQTRDSKNEIKSETKQQQQASKSRVNASCAVSNNQAFIKIIRNDETIVPVHMTKISESTVVIEELDKCLAEYEVKAEYSNEAAVHSKTYIVNKTNQAWVIILFLLTCMYYEIHVFRCAIKLTNVPQTFTVRCCIYIQELIQRRPIVPCNK